MARALFCGRAASRVALWTGCLALAAIVSAPVGSQQANTQPAAPKASGALQSAGAGLPPAPAAAKTKPDTKKAKEEYKKGRAAEKQKDWPTAYHAYAEAYALDPENDEYHLRREVARGRAAQVKADAAERDAVAGKLDEARQELQEAHLLDPTDTVISERQRELSMAAPIELQPAEPKIELEGEVHLQTTPGTQSFDFRGGVQDAYLEVAHKFGVDAAFDVDLISRPVHLQINNVDFKTAMQMLEDMTGTFWRPVTEHLLFVAENTPAKRKEYDVSLTRTILLPASETQEQMTEILRMVREVAGVAHTTLDEHMHTITIRADPQSLAVATDLVENLEKPLGQLVLEIEILQVDRTYAQQLGITPPQSTQLYTVSPQQAQIAEQSEAGLISVIEQIFGTPSSLAGLSNTQISSLLSSGQLTNLIPPVVPIGNGKSLFLATLPGTSANFSQMLSLVRDGRRILLRAEDGQPATFFVGDHIPVSLAQYSASLGGAGVNVPGVSSTEFPSTNYPTGNGPTFITAADLLGSGTEDLVVSNFTDNTVSVLLGNGDGTFQTQVPYDVGTGPVCVATGNFTQSGYLDLAVANQGANTISILLGNGDGTFQTQTTIPTGNQPSFVVAADMHDTTGTGYLDLVVANKKDNTIAIYQGNGDGTFQNPTLITLPAGYSPSSLVAADFNGDGHLDLAVTDQGNNSVSVFLGNGNGTFGARTDYPVGNSPVWVSTADFNADGIPDLAVANNGQPTDTLAGNSVSILLGQANPNNTSVGTGAFGTQTAYAAGNGPTSIAVADYNVDGIPDLAVTAQSDNSVAVLLGQGPGTFGPYFELPVGTDPLSIVTEVFDTSGRAEVATANNGSNNATVILNDASFSSGNGLSGTQFPGAQYIDVGLKVKATPRIHADHEVTLQLEFDISSVTSQTFNNIPVISNDEVEQTVRLRENETSVIAGMIQEQVMKAISGTPGIESIPVVGGLEGDQATQKADSELLIMLTPRMVYLSPRKDRAIYAGQGAPAAGGFSAVGPGRENEDFGQGPQRRGLPVQPPAEEQQQQQQQEPQQQPPPPNQPQTTPQNQPQTQQQSQPQR